MSTNPEATQHTEIKVANNEPTKVQESVIPKFIPYFSAVFILIGIIKLVIYYNKFNIKIVQFLNFGEIITSWLDNLLGQLMLVILIFVICYPLLNVRQVSEENPQNTFFKKIWLFCSSMFQTYQALRYWVIILGVLLLPALFFYWTYIKMSPYFLEWNMVTSVVAFVALVFFIETLEKQTIANASRAEKQVTFLCMLVFLLMFGAIKGTLADIKNVIDKKKYNKVTIKFEDSSLLVSDSFNYYIGKTEDYIFFHHEKTKVTDVFPVSRITELHFPQPPTTVKK